MFGVKKQKSSDLSVWALFTFLASFCAEERLFVAQASNPWPLGDELFMMTTAVDFQRVFNEFKWAGVGLFFKITSIKFI